LIPLKLKKENKCYKPKRALTSQIYRSSHEGMCWIIRIFAIYSTTHL